MPFARRPGVLGRNRFDDPAGQFVVRYLADTARGCFVELLGRFRLNKEAEDRIANVAHIDPQDDRTRGGPDAIGDWLDAQYIARCHLASPDTAVLVSVNDAKLLADFNWHPAIRGALDNAAAHGLCPDPAELDGATIRLRGPVGLRITQAVSQALREQIPRLSGVAYRSLRLRFRSGSEFDHELDAEGLGDSVERVEFG